MQATRLPEQICRKTYIVLPAYTRVLPICIALYGQIWDVGCMSKTTLSPIDLTADPVPLAAAAVHSLIQTLPAGTAFCIGIVFIVMMTGRLVQTKGSLARAVFPFVAHLRWGWHRVERA